MKVFKIAALAVAMTTLSWAQCTPGELWSTGGTSQTNYGGGGGYWYGFTDAGESGTSTWSCGGVAVAEGDPFPAECMASGAISVDFSITSDATDGTYTWGYAAIAFDVLDNGTGAKAPGDFSCATGIGLDYSTTKAVYLKLTSNANSANPAQYQVKLPTTGATFIPFTDFAQPSWAAGAQVFAFDPTDVEAVQFQAHSENGVGDFTFTLNKICLGECGGVSVLDHAEGTNFSVNFSNQGLRFAGLKEMGKMNVEMFNLQGQKVASQVVSSARNFLSTSSLRNGLYVVKASNADYNFTRQVQVIR